MNVHFLIFWAAKVTLAGSVLCPYLNPMADIDPDPQQRPALQARQRKELTALETRQVICELLRALKDPNDVNNLRRGALTDIA